MNPVAVLLMCFTMLSFFEGSPVVGCRNNRIDGLIGHWRMDEETGNEVADDSGYENHGLAVGPVSKLSKFTRGRYFNSNEIISVSDSPVLNFGTSSFTVTGWIKILDVTYPLTTFAVQKGFGCYFSPGQQGWVAGWETGHHYRAHGLDVCIRDQNNRMVRGTISFDNSFQQHLGQWVHYAVVFDRQQHKKAFVYINGQKQSNFVDISTVTGSINNNRDLSFGNLYGWKTKGTLDEYRLYNKALDDFDVTEIHKDHLL